MSGTFEVSQASVVIKAKADVLFIHEVCKATADDCLGTTTRMFFQNIFEGDHVIENQGNVFVV